MGWNLVDGMYWHGIPVQFPVSLEQTEQSHKVNQHLDYSLFAQNIFHYVFLDNTYFF